MAKSVYLDYNATTPLAPEVLETITATLSDAWANPSSSHPAGKFITVGIKLAAATEAPDQL